MSENKYKKIRDRLLLCWDEKTKFKGSYLWDSEKSFNTKSRGQCYPTALLLNKVFGGEIWRGSINHESHYWNFIDGEEVDLTSDQFGGNGFLPITKKTRVLKNRDKNWNNERFLLLWERWDKEE